MPSSISDVLSGDAEAIRCPYQAYADVRESGSPVFHDVRSDIYVVSRHRDIAAVTTNPRTFSNTNPFGPTVLAAVEAVSEVMKHASAELVRKAETVSSRGPVLFTVDPPEHTRHRKLLSKALTPRAVANIENDVRKACHQLVDEFVEDGAVELVRSFATPAPIMALARLLGVPEDATADFIRWAESINAAIGRNLTHEQVRASMEGQLEFWEYFETEFAARISCPRDDLLTGLVQARVEGERPLDLQEMVGFASQLVGAGADTTTKLLSTGAYMLCRDRALLARVTSDPAILPRFIEEVLRLESPLQGLFRFTTQSAELGGVTIPAGKYVYVLYAAANRDEGAFAQADKLDLDRSGTAHHFAFGNGPHSCIGQALARTVARVGFETLLSRLDRLRLDDVGPQPEYDDTSYILRGFAELRLSFEPAERSVSAHL